MNPSDPRRRTDRPTPLGAWHEGRDALAARCPVQRDLIARYPLEIGSRGDAFQTLVRSIVGQQISVRAADAVWSRLTARVPITPSALASASDLDLRGCGLSARKREYVRDLARHFVDGRLRVERFSELDDETLIRELTDVRGIGRWTAEMFLIFHLNRVDVWPVDDIGLQKAVARLYAAQLGPTFTGDRLAGRALARFGERFAPYRSVATWYLWRALDPFPVAY